MRASTMFRTVLLGIALALLVRAPVSGAGPDNQPIERERLSLASDYWRFRQGLEDRLMDVSDERIAELLDSTDASLALFAGWQQVRRALPRDEETSFGNLDPIALSRFLGLVEGRVGMRVPKAWESRFRTGDTTRSKYTVYKSIQNSSSRRLLRSISRQKDEPWSVNLSDRILMITDDRPRTTANLAIAEDTDSIYVTLYSEYEGESNLMAIDRETGKHKWHSPLIFGDISFFTGTGHWNSLELKVNEASVVAFGMRNGSPYINAFDKVTGNATCRFSTEFVYPVEGTFEQK